MDVLDSHLEALAFNYVRFGLFTLVNNLWTWVAVVTAAVSFWRLRVSWYLKPDHQGLNLTPSSDSAVEPPPPPSSSKPTTTSTSSASSEAAVSSFCGCDGRGARGVTKAKFTAYYGEEERETESESRLLTTAVAEEWDNNDDGGFGFSFDVVFGGGVVGEELKKVVRVRMGDDMGLYRFLDLTAINGNVVKLWDDGCRM